MNDFVVCIFWLPLYDRFIWSSRAVCVSLAAFVGLLVPFWFFCPGFLLLYVCCVFTCMFVILRRVGLTYGRVFFV